MNKILTAIALSIALPAIAHAQTAPAPEATKDCCEKMKAEGKECCCKDMMQKMHEGMKHEGHDKADGAKPEHQGHAQ